MTTLSMQFPVPSGQNSAVRTFQGSAGHVSVASRIRNLCYGRVKSTDFGKATRSTPPEPMLNDVEASAMEASVSDQSSPEVSQESPPAVVTAAGEPATQEVRRKRGRPRDPEADGRILAAASSLILLRGFESMTVDEVASNAGVGKATVYRRWARKEDLAVAAMQQLYQDEMPAPDTGSIREDLQTLYSSVLTFVNSPAGLDYVRTTIKESMRDDRIATLYREASHRAEGNAAAGLRTRHRARRGATRRPHGRRGPVPRQPSWPCARSPARRCPASTSSTTWSSCVLHGISA